MLEKETIKKYKERKIREEKAQQIQAEESASQPSVRKDAGELVVLTKANSFETSIIKEKESNNFKLVFFVLVSKNTDKDLFLF